MTTWFKDVKQWPSFYRAAGVLGMPTLPEGWAWTRDAYLEEYVAYHIHTGSKIKEEHWRAARDRS